MEENRKHEEKDTGLARDHLGDGGYLRRSRSSQPTGCGLLDLGDACEYEKWVAGGVGWSVCLGWEGESIYVYVRKYIYIRRGTRKKITESIKEKRAWGGGGVCISHLGKESEWVNISDDVYFGVVHFFFC